MKFGNEWNTDPSTILRLRSASLRMTFCQQRFHRRIKARDDGLTRRQLLALGGVFDFPAERFDGFAQFIALEKIFCLAGGGALVEERLHLGGDGDGRVAEAEDGVERGPAR